MAVGEGDFVGIGVGEGVAVATGSQINLGIVPGGHPETVGDGFGVLVTAGFGEAVGDDLGVFVAVGFGDGLGDGFGVFVTAGLSMHRQGPMKAVPQSQRRPWSHEDDPSSAQIVPAGQSHR